MTALRMMSPTMTNLPQQSGNNTLYVPFHSAASPFNGCFRTSKRTARRACLREPYANSRTCLPANTRQTSQKPAHGGKESSAYTELRAGQKQLGGMTANTRRGRIRHNAKALGSRSRKRAPWVSALHKELLSEFERVKAASVKTSPEVLRHIAISLIQRVEAESLLAPTFRVDGVKIAAKVTTRWIQEFMESHNLVIRRQTGKLAVSPQKQIYIEKSIAYDMGQLKRCFESG